jgi:hypothetical protein
MSEKKEITSWRGRSVRLKPEFFQQFEEFDGNWDDDENWIVDESLPKVVRADINCPLRGFIDNPANDVFEVAADVYGIDLYKHTYTPFEVGSIEPTHQVILKGKAMNTHPFVWDTKWFDVVRQEHIWVKDERF